MDNIKEKYTFIDLFAGCGGFTEGFLNTGRFEALAHVEWEMPMVTTLRNRLQSRWEHTKEDALKRVIHFDMQKSDELIFGEWKTDSLEFYAKTNHPTIVANGLRGLIGEQKVDLIIGGPPCQSYSLAGRHQHKKYTKKDYRNYLFENFVSVVDEFKPNVFVFENVHGILSAKPDGIHVTERIYNAFKNIGYSIRMPELQKKSIYTATDFGVPQKRKRVIIIGVRDDFGIDVEEFYQELDMVRGFAKHRTVFDAIGHLPKFRPLKETVNINGKRISHELIGDISEQYHEPRYHSQRDIKIFREWIGNNMNHSFSHEKLAFYNDKLNKNSNYFKYRNLEWNTQSPTITAHLHKDGLMFIHPDVEQARSITIKEAALLQSFPNDYEFLCSQSSAFKMIGNAVPPLLSQKIAEAIYRVLIRNNKNRVDINITPKKRHMPANPLF